MASVKLNNMIIDDTIATEPFYVKQEPYVGDDGIYVPVYPYVQEGCASAYRCIMTKEMFVEAYNKYIKDKRKYKGGWKRKR